MLLFVLYFFAILVLQGVASDFQRIHPSSEAARLLRINFSGVPQAVLSLFMGITGGKDWSELYSPLAHLHWVYGAVFLFFVYFCVFGVLNIVTSVFVDATYQATLSDRNHVVQSELDRNRMYMNSCREFFLAADKNTSGDLTWEEFEEYLQDEKVRAYLATLELDESQAKVLFTLLDVHEENAVSVDEFVQGCAKLRGDAKSIDVNMLLYENQKMICKWLDFMDLAGRKLETIEACLGIEPGDTESETSAEKVKPMGPSPSGRTQVARFDMMLDVLHSSSDNERRPKRRSRAASKSSEETMTTTKSQQTSLTSGGRLESALDTVAKIRLSESKT